MFKADSHHDPSDLSQVAVLIPVWKPDKALPEIMRSLAGSGFGAIILVDDGSPAAFTTVFKEALRYPGIHYIRHAINLGKGRAIKTGINYCLLHHPDLLGVITADADGQHRPDDILRVALAFSRSPQRAVLGARQFLAGVPLRSRIGNQITRLIFRFITGRKLTDTQTGLRALPGLSLSRLLQLRGERYEYEMSMLAYLCGEQMPLEVPIRTVYIDGNRSSHFDPIRDSLRIYFALLRFSVSSAIETLVNCADFLALKGRPASDAFSGRINSRKQHNDPVSG